MDIHFSCPACGHHMVIDEAGAGMIVACTECGRDTPIPKTATPMPKRGADPAEAPSTEKERTVAMKWTPPETSPHSEPKK